MTYIPQHCDRLMEAFHDCYCEVAESETKEPHGTRWLTLGDKVYRVSLSERPLTKKPKGK